MWAIQCLYVWCTGLLAQGHHRWPDAIWRGRQPASSCDHLVARTVADAAHESSAQSCGTRVSCLRDFPICIRFCYVLWQFASVTFWVTTFVEFLDTCKYRGMRQKSEKSRGKGQKAGNLCSQGLWQLHRITYLYYIRTAIHISYVMFTENLE